MVYESRVQKRGAIVNQVKKIVSSTLSLGTVLCLPFISPSHAVDYSFEPCCNLCTQAADPESYNTAFRRKFRQLQAGKDGWLFRSHQDFMETFGPDESGYQDLQEMHQLLLAKGTRLVMAIQPTRALAHPEFVDPSTSQFDWGLAKMGFNTMMQRFQSLGIPIADFSEFIPFQAEGFYFFRRDHHWTPTGAKVSAEKVAEVIKQFPEYEQIPPVEISSSQSGLINKVGTLQVAAHQICGFNYPNEYVPQYSSSATLNSDLLDDSSLFDDELPQITLIGTSNSRGTVDYNFQGFLMEALQRDVLNVAMAGAGYYGALVQYLLSDDYIDAPPKIIVWEVPPYHKLQSPLFYRQAKPMITNGCQSREVVMSDTQSLSVCRNELLFIGGG